MAVAWDMAPIGVIDKTHFVEYDVAKVIFDDTQYVCNRPPEYKFQSDGLDNLNFDDAITKHASHTSISLFKHSISGNYEFSFSPISMQSMSKYISSLNSNKAVGHDGLHAAFLKCSGDNMSTSWCNVFNASIYSCDFPSTLNWADINPIYKKKDNLCKENYRLMFLPLSLRYLKEFYPISWWITLYLYWVIRYLLIELVTAASTWFYNSPNFGANPLIKEIALELWQWICQRPLIACHMDSKLLSCLHMMYLNMRVIWSLTICVIDVRELKLWANVANGSP